MRNVTPTNSEIAAVDSEALTEPIVGIFIVAHTQNNRAIQKSVSSINKLGYKKLRIYLIDKSSDAQYRALAKKLSLRYFNVLLSDAAIYQKIASIKNIAATLTLTPGIVVKKTMLANLVPYLTPSVSAVTATLVVKHAAVTDTATPHILGIRHTPAVQASERLPIIAVPVEVATVDAKLYGEDEKAIVEHGLRQEQPQRRRWFGQMLSPVFVYALIALIVLPLPLIFAISALTTMRDQAPTNSNQASAPISQTAPTTPPASSTTSDTAAAANQTPATPAAPATAPMQDPDQGPAKTATLPIKPGDSMSSLITDYINTMHEAFPHLTLARLGYAQDRLMHVYGYAPLPAGQATFTITAEDVTSAWDTADMADSWEAFWADYALRAGIKW